MRFRLLLSAAVLGLAAPVAAAEQRPILAPSEAPNSAERPVGFATTRPAGGVLVLPVRSAADVAAIDVAGVTAAAQVAKFTGKAGKTLSLRGLGGYAQVLLVGVGDTALTAPDIADMAGTALQETRGEAAPVAIDLRALPGADPVQAALGATLGQYRFDRYKTVGKSAPPVQPVTIVTTADTSGWARDWKHVADAARFTRDLQTEPANVKYPEWFAAQVTQAFRGIPNVRVEILDEAAMGKLGMGTLLGVGQGSAKPSRLVLVHYTGGQGTPVALVGKGITFDSGGISLKPGAGMWEMKSDMSGAAAVMGATWAAAKRGAPVNVIGVAALAENMPGDNAQRPGDVTRTMSGKTVETLNTDAEGRLVLTDANEYVISRYRPAAVVNIATLTGAIVRALDDEYAGLFARQDALAAQFLKAGEASGEVLWRMPLHENYYDDMKSDIADIKNVVENGGPGAGLAAHFLQYFVPQSTPWAHLDIAGVNWNGKAEPTKPKGASGFGVRLLDAFVRGWQPVAADPSGGPK